MKQLILPVNQNIEITFIIIAPLIAAYDYYNDQVKQAIINTHQQLNFSTPKLSKCFKDFQFQEQIFIKRKNKLNYFWIIDSSFEIELKQIKSFEVLTTSQDDQYLYVSNEYTIKQINRNLIPYL